MSTWTRFVRDDEPGGHAGPGIAARPQDQIDLAFNSKMTGVFRSSDLEQIVDGMIAHMKEKIENLTLINSRFRFNQVLHLDVSFH